MSAADTPTIGGARRSATSRPTRALAVVARPLLSGRVKTRLADHVGADAALRAYARLLAGTLASAGALGPDHQLVLALTAAQPDIFTRLRRLDGSRSWCADRWELGVQRGRNLGERLASLFDDLASDGARQVVIVNSDSPGLPTEFLAQAFRRLAGEAGAPDGVVGPHGTFRGARHTVGGTGVQAASDERGADDVVFGPAADGGFYLIGVSTGAWARSGAALRAALASAPMGGPRALAHMALAARELGLRVSDLPMWTDVDDAGDLAFLDRLAGPPPDRFTHSPMSAPRLRGEPLRELREVYLHVTERCGRGCVHCYNGMPAAGEPELTTGEWRDVIDQSVALGARNFVFIGGDPLLRDDLPELIDHVTGTHGRGARFFFNGSIGEQRAGTLAEAGHGRLRPLPSVDGTREANDALRGPGNYDEVMSSLRALVAVGLEPVANTVLLRPVLPTLPALARELAAARVQRLHLILPHQRGSLPAHLDLIPTGAEMLAALRQLLPAAHAAGLVVDNLSSWRRRLAAPEDLCTAGCRDLAIDPYGRVHACAITCGDAEFVAGDVRRQSIQSIWHSSPALRLLRASRARDRAECSACPVVDACGGECWVQAHYAARAQGRPAGYGAAFPYCDLVRPVFEELLAEAGTAEAAGDGEATRAPAACASDASGAGGGHAAAGAADYALFDCI